MSSVNNIIPNTIKIRSKSYSKHLLEYFLLKLDYLYVLALLLTISIFFFMYRADEKLPQEYLINFIILGILGIVLSCSVGIYHWIKNSSRKKDTETVNDLIDKTDITETWLKRSQFIVTTIFLLSVVIISSVKLNKGNIPSSISYGVGVVSMILFTYTLFVFFYSFYYVANRTYRVGVMRDVLEKAQTASQLRK